METTDKGVAVSFFPCVSPRVVLAFIILIVVDGMTGTRLRTRSSCYRLASFDGRRSLVRLRRGMGEVQRLHGRRSWLTSSTT